MFFTGIVAFIKTTYSDVYLLACHPRKSIRSLYRVSLYRNAGYLIANAIVIAVLGMCFWLVAARLYSEEDVGLGSALISAGMLLSFIGTLGFGYGIIRFLPVSNNKAKLVNSSLTISLFTSVIAAIIFLIGLSLWAPDLIFVREDAVYFVAFVIFISVGALNTVLNQTFIGFRRSGFTLAKGIILNVLKLILVLGLVVVSKSFGIFASWGLATLASFLVGLFLFLPQILTGFRLFLYKPAEANITSELNDEVIRYSLSNYIGNLLQNTPNWILPLLVLNLLGAESNAHFYIVWSIANIVFSVPLMISMALFVEGSNLEGEFEGYLRKSLKLMGLVTLPAILVLFLLGGKILLIFGREYSEDGTHLLWLYTLSVIPTSINYIYLGIARVEKKLKDILVVTGFLAFFTIISSYVFIQWFDVIGIGIGWLASQSIMAIVVFIKIRRRLN